MSSGAVWGRSESLDEAIGSLITYSDVPVAGFWELVMALSWRRRAFRQQTADSEMRCSDGGEKNKKYAADGDDSDVVVPRSDLKAGCRSRRN